MHIYYFQKKLTQTIITKYAFYKIVKSFSSSDALNLRVYLFDKSRQNENILKDIIFYFYDFATLFWH